MPTYEYVCKNCGHLFEIVQSMRDDALTECPECGGVLRKVFAPPAISFKGSGFYATDHGKKGTSSGSSAKKAEGEPSAAPAGGGDGASGSDGSGGSERGSTSDPGSTSDKGSKSDAGSRPSPAAKPPSDASD
jgi:putative FmdB family regulatory protein